MQDIPADTSKEVSTRPGFTVVEDDDVSFGMALSREIHRIYGMYMAGELPATDSVRDGLLLTMEMFSTLQNTVTDGMPALRLQVGAAQAREMVGALFGHDLPTRRSRELSPDRNRAHLHRTNRSIATHTARHAIGRPSPDPFQGDRHELVEVNPPTSPSETAVGLEAPAIPESEIGAPTAASSRLARLARCWERQTLAVKIVATLIGMVLAASAIDAPFAIVALFPSFLIPLTALFVGACIASKPAYRMIRSRRAASA
jgi:hypothetical protein